MEKHNNTKTIQEALMEMHSLLAAHSHFDYHLICGWNTMRCNAMCDWPARSPENGRKQMISAVHERESVQFTNTFLLGGKVIEIIVANEHGSKKNLIKVSRGPNGNRTIFQEVMIDSQVQIEVKTLTWAVGPPSQKVFMFNFNWMHFSLRDCRFWSSLFEVFSFVCLDFCCA